jgi:methionyl-tRNA formyltransferase
LRILFLGTPAFALPVLSAVAKRHDVVAVVTRPPRPAGRGLRPQPSPVAEAARALGLPVLEPERLTAEVTEDLLRLPFEVGVLAAYGALLPPPLLARGILNVHPSLLPRWRGPDPIRRALWHGDTETGVSVLWLTERLDAGPIVAQRAVPIRPEDDAGTLSERLAALGAELLVGVLEQRAAGADLPGTPQDEARATYAGKIAPEEEVLPFDLDVHAAWCRVRALAPRPGAKVWLAGKAVQVLEAAPLAGADGPPGAWRVRDGRLLVGFRDGALELRRVKPAGGKAMAGADYARGHLGA